ncbi:MAG: type II secretion system protein, partial [Planctomycetota bacterium]|nr:type II secretion system protein [Planctomycetota bacterium]
MNRPAQKFRAFTLIELLAVIGIIAILGVVITTSAQRISKDAKLAGATNQVLATLGEARAIAIRDRATVLVGFTVRRSTIRATPSSPETIDFSRPQQTEIVIA